jgi:hypothetical protein
VLATGRLQLHVEHPAQHVVRGGLVDAALASVRAQRPATCPDGGTGRTPPCTGSCTHTHGQYSAANFES